MNSTGKLYGIRQSGASHGDVFTSSRVVRFMLDLMGYTPDKNLSSVTILEPSCGEGEFLLEIQKRIVDSAELFGFDATEALNSNVFACEIDSEKIRRCIRRIKSVTPEFDPRNIRNCDFLLSEWDISFDFIVGNPPYIRYENIPTNKRTDYKHLFKTFHYRCDLYVLFYEHSLSMLSDGGRHCFICSNRWLKNEYGRKLRALISYSYNLEYLIDAESINAFHEDVLAYPSISLISRSASKNMTRTAKLSHIHELDNTLDYVVKEPRKNEHWEDLFLDSDLDSFHTLKEQNFTIGIGVATGADKIFISPDFKDLIENDILLPLINARDLSGNTLTWKGNYLLNPYNEDGSLIELDKFPKARKYLEERKDILSDRHIVKCNKAWYSLIDKVKPDLVKKPKILLPDISGNRILFVDNGGFYPAHNIYYITGNDYYELIVVACLLMSDFARNQINAISNKMNGGFPRWQSQSINKLRLPAIKDINERLRNMLISSYTNRDIASINLIVDEIVEKAHRLRHDRPVNTVPDSLFDYGFSAS